MIEVKKSVAVLVPVYLVAATGLPVTGVLAATITCTVLKSDGSTASVTVTGNWTEITTGAFSGQGVYTLQLAAGNVDTQGLLVYMVTHSGTAKAYRGAVKVVTNEEVDTKTVVDAIRTDYTTVRAVKIDNLDATTSSRASATNLALLDTAVSALDDDITELHTAQFGKWEIKVSGPDANRLIMYEVDGTTVLKKFNLTDDAGDPTSTAPFKRDPV